MTTRMSLNFGHFRSRTAELAALERLKNPYIFIMGEIL